MYNNSANFDTLKNNIRKMFFEDWDPIGVNHYPSAIDEYDSYADELAAALQHDSPIDEAKILEYLRWVLYEHIGLSHNTDLEQKTNEFAHKLKIVLLQNCQRQ